jgi:hypothetical protein
MFWSFVHRIRVTLISAVVGGIGGGAAMAIAMTASNASNPLLFLVTGVFVAFIFGTFGASLGGAIGLLPTMLLGAVLSLLRRTPPFHHWGTWVFSGAAAGAVMAMLTNHLAGNDSPHATPTPALAQAYWFAAWIVGGASAMFAYWKVETNWAKQPRA